MDSKTGLLFMQGYVSMEIQRIVWKPHGISRSYTNDFVTGRQLTKSMKNRQGYKLCSTRCMSVGWAVKLPLYL